MILAEKSVGDLFSVFQQQLQPLYPAEEIRSMLFRLFEHHLGWSRADVHLKKATSLNEPSQKSLKMRWSSYIGQSRYNI